MRYLPQPKIGDAVAVFGRTRPSVDWPFTSIPLLDDAVGGAFRSPRVRLEDVTLRSCATGIMILVPPRVETRVFGWIEGSVAAYDEAPCDGVEPLAWDRGARVFRLDGVAVDRVGSVWLDARACWATRWVAARPGGIAGQPADPGLVSGT